VLVRPKIVLTCIWLSFNQTILSFPKWCCMFDCCLCSFAWMSCCECLYLFVSLLHFYWHIYNIYLYCIMCVMCRCWMAVRVSTQGCRSAHCRMKKRREQLHNLKNLQSLSPSQHWVHILTCTLAQLHTLLYQLSFRLTVLFSLVA